jgi:hypothetical protein
MIADLSPLIKIFISQCVGTAETISTVVVNSARCVGKSRACGTERNSVSAVRHPLFISSRPSLTMPCTVFVL